MTNELGAFGAVRFLKNVAGLWLVQQCEAAFAAEGRARSWDELAALARAAEPLRSVVDPNDPATYGYAPEAYSYRAWPMFWDLGWVTVPPLGMFGGGSVGGVGIGP